MNSALEVTDEDRVRVLVIGESPVIRAGLEAAIADSERFEVVGACNLAGSPSLLESTAAAAVLMESASFSNCLPGYMPENESGPRLPSASLTPREIEVLRLLADGASNKTIGHKLGISDHTVKFHVTSILSKMNAGTRTEAVMLGVRMGLVYL